jgi:WD40 repeat protein
VATWEPQSRYLATAGEDGYICLWDVDAATAACVLTRPHSGRAVTHLSWSADSRRIVSAGEDKTVRVRCARCLPSSYSSVSSSSSCCCSCGWHALVVAHGAT